MDTSPSIAVLNLPEYENVTRYKVDLNSFFEIAKDEHRL